MQQASPARSKPALSNLSLANIPTSVYKVLLLLVTMAWGASFVYMKDLVAVFPPGWLLGIRFTIAGLVILPFLLKRLRLRLTWKALAAGMVMGLLDFLGFFTQTVGLQTVSPGINAFLTAVYVVLVPFMWWVVAKRKPTKANIVAAFVAIVGIWLVSVTSASGSLSIGFGEIMTLFCAFFFAAHIVSVSIFSVFYDVLMLTVIQFITEGLLGLATGAVFETFPALTQITPVIAGELAFVVLFATIFAFGVQNIALARIEPTQASLILSLESVFGVLFSILLYGELLTVRLVVGFVLIFIALLVSEGIFSRKRKTAS